MVSGSGAAVATGGLGASLAKTDVLCTGLGGEAGGVGLTLGRERTALLTTGAALAGVAGTAGRGSIMRVVKAVVWTGLLMPNWPLARSSANRCAINTRANKRVISPNQRFPADRCGRMSTAPARACFAGCNASRDASRDIRQVQQAGERWLEDISQTHHIANRASISGTIKP